eukprot:TRINITY_DN947_c0_g1_i4.p1 TRINITY_DN947_c0_g1~~TRINITY_DN947_c0_g1_i4.p1  ORF type:complete len:264 (+),score=31.38 TRINITY_DN947_c0_g1_i4:38-829(+)
MQLLFFLSLFLTLTLQLDAQIQPNFGQVYFLTDSNYDQLVSDEGPWLIKYCDKLMSESVDSVWNELSRIQERFYLGDSDCEGHSKKKCQELKVQFPFPHRYPPIRLYYRGVVFKYIKKAVEPQSIKNWAFAILDEPILRLDPLDFPASISAGDWVTLLWQQTMPQEWRKIAEEMPELRISQVDCTRAASEFFIIFFFSKTTLTSIRKMRICRGYLLSHHYLVLFPSVTHDNFSDTPKVFLKERAILSPNRILLKLAPHRFETL